MKPGISSVHQSLKFQQNRNANKETSVARHQCPISPRDVTNSKDVRHKGDDNVPKL